MSPIFQGGGADILFVFVFSNYFVFISFLVFSPQPGLSPPACININKTTIFCEHTNPFGNSVKSDVRTEFSIELDATNLPLNLTDFTIRGLLNT